jgi:hypothetical protein
MGTKEKISTIAEITREDIDANTNLLLDLGFVFKRDLGGLCAVASKLLEIRFLRESLAAKVVQGNTDPTDERLATHCWCQCEGLVVDITATQFNMPPVVIQEKPVKNLWGCAHFPMDRTNFNGWPITQKPIVYKIRQFDTLVRNNRKNPLTFTRI